MADELELKAVVPNAAALRTRLLAAGAEPGFVGEMNDRRYDRGGELAPRDEVLRVRTYAGAAGQTEWRLSWKGPTRRSPEGYKLRDERECRVTGAVAPDEILTALGYEVVHRLDRRIEMFALGEATLRIEVFPQMDVLLEVEGDPASIEKAIDATGLPRESFTAEPLAAFVARYESAAGRAVLVREP
jgi:adenylate cyclase class IV